MSCRFRLARRRGRLFGSMNSDENEDACGAELRAALGLLGGALCFFVAEVGGMVSHCLCPHLRDLHGEVHRSLLVVLFANSIDFFAKLFGL